MNMAIQIKLENFEGPLDLLIHLIDKNQMSITEIDISKIIEDYLSYISEAQELNLKIKDIVKELNKLTIENLKSTKYKSKTY